ncbi:hypothetical protein [Roseomonas chloroacetimidivorans]|uniref:hypothetical protein n=1 Tax=Roseomonas chloroacetimidivorans TaxID=1766656 RepID=UPI003C71874D
MSGTVGNVVFSPVPGSPYPPPGPCHAEAPDHLAKHLGQPALTPPPDFWDRVAREVAKLMVERQGILSPPYPPAVADAREHG